MHQRRRSDKLEVMPRDMFNIVDTDNLFQNVIDFFTPNVVDNFVLEYIFLGISLFTLKYDYLNMNSNV